jgi:hypothetical protein
MQDGFGLTKFVLRGNACGAQRSYRYSGGE